MSKTRQMQLQLLLNECLCIDYTRCTHSHRSVYRMTYGGKMPLPMDPDVHCAQLCIQSSNKLMLID